MANDNRICHYVTTNGDTNIAVKGITRPIHNMLSIYIAYSNLVW